MSKSYCFTINNWTEEHKTFLSSLLDRLECLVYGEEIAPTTNTPHLQGYLRFKKIIKITTLANMMNGIHYIIAKGSPMENYKYCTKDGKNIFEFGTFTNVSQGKKFEEFKEDIKKGMNEKEYSEKYTDLYIRYSTGMNKYAFQQDEYQEKIRNIEVLVYWGETGTGKSYKARIENPGAFWLSHNNNLWWDGYTGQKTIIIDDFYGWIQFHKLLRILDENPYQVEVKGGFRWAHWEKVIITSNKEPKEWYTNEKIDYKLQESLLDRFSIIQKFTGESKRKRKRKEKKEEEEK